MSRTKHPQLFLDAHHRRDYDTLIERRSDARMWLRKFGRMHREQAPDIPPMIAEWQRKRARIDRSEVVE